MGCELYNEMTYISFQIIGQYWFLRVPEINKNKKVILKELGCAETA